MVKTQYLTRTDHGTDTLYLGRNSNPWKEAHHMAIKLRCPVELEAPDGTTYAVDGDAIPVMTPLPPRVATCLEFIGDVVCQWLDHTQDKTEVEIAEATGLLEALMQAIDDDAPNSLASNRLALVALGDAMRAAGIEAETGNAEARHAHDDIEALIVWVGYHRSKG